MTGSMTIDTRYAIREGSWHTPEGRPCTFAYRDGTNDWNTLQATLDGDEYDVPSGLSGYALDVGGYLGSVGIALAIDNADLQVTILEPVPENCDLIAQNIDLNGVSDRVDLVRGSAGMWQVRYGFTGSESLEHHSFVGNSTLFRGADGDHSTLNFDPHFLDDFWPAQRISLLKIDAEGAEWIFLHDPAVSRIDLIVGEAHEVSGHKGGDIVELLAATHDVTLSGNPEGTCGFRALRHA